MHLKKHLKFSSMRDMISEIFDSIEDKRAANSSNSLTEVML